MEITCKKENAIKELLKALNEGELGDQKQNLDSSTWYGRQRGRYLEMLKGAVNCPTLIKIYEFCVGYLKVTPKNPLENLEPMLINVITRDNSVKTFEILTTPEEVEKTLKELRLSLKEREITLIILGKKYIFNPLSLHSVETKDILRIF